MTTLVRRLLALTALRRPALPPAPAPDKDCRTAYATVLSTGAYAPGALALAFSLAEAGCRRPFVVFVADTVDGSTIDRLAACGLSLRRIQPIAASEGVLAARNAAAGYAHWSATFDKLALFSQTGFDKLVYLDSDMMVLENIDPLFERAHLSAVAAGRSFHGKQHWDRLNSGLLVIEPETDLTQRLIATMERLAAAPESARLNPGGMLGDQDVIGVFAPDWPERTDLHLPGRFNVFLEHADHYARLPGAEGGVAVVHFAGARKPWQLSKWALLREILRHARQGRPLAALCLAAYGRLLALARARQRRSGG